MGKHGIIMAGLMILLCINAALVKSDNKGFVSIDCGLQEANVYIFANNSTYVRDELYIEDGVNKNIDYNYVDANNPRLYLTVRAFNNYERSCYDLKTVVVGDRYLIRATFMYGNYDGLNIPPSFDLYIGVDLWYMVKLDNASHVLWTETIVQATSTSIFVCLVNNGNGTPFISVLELRPMGNDSYLPVDNTKSLLTYRRINLGATKQIRYPEDYYDRIWTPDTNFYGWQWGNVSTVVDGGALWRIPSAVMQTIEVSSPLIVTWTANLSERFYVYLYFARLIGYDPWAGPWVVYIKCNLGDACSSTNFTLELDKTVVWKNTQPLTNSAQYILQIITPRAVDYNVTKKYPDAALNAYEIYKYYDLSGSATYDQDVTAINAIRDYYGIKKNWKGDPCLPKSWGGVTCDNSNNYLRPTIVALNLSRSNLTGDIVDSFSNLQSLKSLDLSCNTLSPSVPSILQQRVNNNSLKLT